MFDKKRIVTTEQIKEGLKEQFDLHKDGAGNLDETDFDSVIEGIDYLVKRPLFRFHFPVNSLRQLALLLLNVVLVLVILELINR